eukprot:ANDGO_08264.mRNA.1 Protein cwh43
MLRSKRSAAEDAALSSSSGLGFATTNSNGNHSSSSSSNGMSAGASPSRTFVISAAIPVLWYGVCGVLLFCGVVAIASYSFYYEVVKNSLFQYPDEWWPSVSACLGDYMETHWFSQYFLAFAVGPRICFQALTMVYVAVCYGRNPATANRFYSALNLFCYVLEVARMLLICTFVVITSSEWHARHDMAAQTHIALTIIYLPLSTFRFSKVDRGTKILGLTATKARTLWTAVWFANSMMLGYFFVQHKTHAVPGAYSIFAIHELLLILFDIVYDMFVIWDFKHTRLSFSVL